MTLVYLTLGIALMGGLFYALTQITARQRRLNAELTRLERLSAEVAMNAEAILDKVDERLDRLTDMAAKAEARMVAPTPTQTTTAKTTPTQSAPPSEPPTLRAPTSLQRYQEVRARVWTLADQGAQPATIARAVGIPRGEVLLMLNLRGRKVTA